MHSTHPVFPSCFLVVLGVLGLAITATLATAEEAPPRLLTGTGAWTATEHSVEGQDCEQVWVCGPAEAIRHRTNEEVSFSPDERTIGVCEPRHGQACGFCKAPEPESACTWHLEQASEVPQ